jgi:uncharacterized repeat protein (TIGR02059 family)
MRKLLILALLWSFSTLYGATYYVSPSGSDASGNGSIGSPWFTLNKAWSGVIAGDIIYMRGGNYYYTSPQNLSGKSGNSSNLIQLLAYPGEKPIINGRDMDTQHNWNLISITNANYLYIKGIRISNLPQPVVIPNSNGYYAVSMGNYDPKSAVWVTNITFDQVELDHIGGWGCTIFEHCTDISWINCDSHHNQDPYSNRFGGDNYGGSDGWESAAETSTRIHFIGCRSWWNSDDGWDNRYATGIFTYDHCWSFRNGFIPNTYTLVGNGEGFKLQGPNANSSNTDNIIRIVQNCLSFDNQAGYEGVAEPYYGGMHLYNNVSFRNYGAMNFQGTHSTATVLKNNITVQSNWSTVSFGDSYNSWNLSASASASDFMSVDTTGATGPRQADGSLPNLNFLHLKTGSKMIDAGTDVGIGYTGSAPDLGAFEVQSGSTPAIPVYTGSSVENSTPSILTLTYDLSLTNIIPAVSSYTVMVNSVLRTVSSVAISGNTVKLTLSSPVVYGDNVTVAYTKPATNPVQTSAGGQAAGFTAQAVTNKVAAVSPVYISSSVENSAPSVLVLTYDLSLSNVIPAATSYTVMVNSVARTVSSVAISGTTVKLTLSSPVIYGDNVTVAYTKPATNPVQTAAGGQAASFTAQAVTNKVVAANLAYVSSSVENSTPSLLEMTYNLTLASVAPAASSFSVLVNSVSLTVSSVAISGTKVRLTLASRIFPGDIVTIAYTAPATGYLQTGNGGVAASISKQPVVNNCLNTAPSVTLTSPVTNSTFTSPASVTLSANSTDADGKVSLVEFYNGTTKLGSVTTAPYTFTWTSVPEGTYSLTAVATDNLSAKTTSQAVAITVSAVKTNPNHRPVVRISNPHKGNVYDNLSSITIDAYATDSDGLISKVELYNGSVKLVEMTDAPYSFTWKDVAAGTYVIYAVATDNMNDTAMSAPVEFVVGASTRFDAKSDVINLYPNPNNGHFTIDFVNPLRSETSTIIITDMTGKQIFNGPVSNEELSRQIDLSNVRTGMYVMMIKDKEILVTKKFIVN